MEILLATTVPGSVLRDVDQDGGQIPSKECTKKYLCHQLINKRFKVPFLAIDRGQSQTGYPTSG